MIGEFLVLPVWREIEAVWPCVVCIEYKAKFPPPVDHAARRQACLGRIGLVWRVGRVMPEVGKGKRLLARRLRSQRCNAFFVSNDKVARRFADLFSAESHHHLPSYYLKFNVQCRMPTMALDLNAG